MGFRRSDQSHRKLGRYSRLSQVTFGDSAVLNICLELPHDQQNVIRNGFKTIRVDQKIIAVRYVVTCSQKRFVYQLPFRSVG